MATKIGDVVGLFKEYLSDKRRSKMDEEKLALYGISLQQENIKNDLDLLKFDLKDAREAENTYKLNYETTKNTWESLTGKTVDPINATQGFGVLKDNTSDTITEKYRAKIEATDAVTQDIISESSKLKTQIRALEQVKQFAVHADPAHSKAEILEGIGEEGKKGYLPETQLYDPADFSWSAYKTQNEAYYKAQDKATQALMEETFNKQFTLGSIQKIVDELNVPTIQARNVKLEAIGKLKDDEVNRKTKEMNLQIHNKRFGDTFKADYLQTSKLSHAEVRGAVTPTDDYNFDWFSADYFSDAQGNPLFNQEEHQKVVSLFAVALKMPSPEQTIEAFNKYDEETNGGMTAYMDLIGNSPGEFAGSIYENFKSMQENVKKSRLLEPTWTDEKTSHVLDLSDTHANNIPKMFEEFAKVTMGAGMDIKDINALEEGVKEGLNENQLEEWKQEKLDLMSSKETEIDKVTDAPIDWSAVQQKYSDVLEDARMGGVDLKTQAMLKENLSKQVKDIYISKVDKKGLEDKINPLLSEIEKLRTKRDLLSTAIGGAPWLEWFSQYSKEAGGLDILGLDFSDFVKLGPMNKTEKEIFKLSKELEEKIFEVEGSVPSPSVLVMEPSLGLSDRLRAKEYQLKSKVEILNATLDKILEANKALD